MQKGFLVKITGNVQGVGFRANAKKQAESLGLKGFVQNKADGSVLLEIVGEASNLQAFLEWCKEGSPSARVSAVRIKETLASDYSNFSIAD